MIGALFDIGALVDIIDALVDIPINNVNKFKHPEQYSINKIDTYISPVQEVDVKIFCM
jgi:hypothetical protein